MAEDMFAQKGWICPKCGRVLAPSTMYCLWCCRDMKETITTTTTTPTTTTIPKWDTTPITVGSRMINSSGTPYLVKTSSISRDSHEIAKDEPQICDICRYYNSNIPCGSTPSACKEADKFAEEFVDGLKKLKPTISKMEQVDKDINVRSKESE